MPQARLRRGVRMPWVHSCRAKESHCLLPLAFQVKPKVLLQGIAAASAPCSVPSLCCPQQGSVLQPTHPEPTFSSTLLFRDVSSSFVTGNPSQPPRARVWEGTWLRMTNGGWGRTDVMPTSPHCRSPCSVPPCPAVSQHMLRGGQADVPEPEQLGGRGRLLKALH